jgi:hypothetical protein
MTMPVIDTRKMQAVKVAAIATASGHRDAADG